MGNALRKLRLSRKWTHDEAAERMGLSRGQFIKLERGERQLTQRTIDLASRAFGVSQGDIMRAQATVPVVGYVGAGGVASYDTALQDENEIDADAPAGTVAVRIRGVSLGPGFDGWYALYSDRRQPFTDDLYGRACVVGTRDGRTLIKWVRRSQGKGVNLVSGIGEIEEDVELVWAAPVISILPP